MEKSCSFLMCLTCFVYVMLQPCISRKLDIFSVYFLNALLMPLPSVGLDAFYVLQYQENYDDNGEYDDEQRPLIVPRKHKPETTTEITKESLEKARKRVWMDCLDQTGVDPELIATLKAGRPDVWNMKKSQLKDWTLCVLNKKELMTRNAVFRVDKLKRWVQQKDMAIAEKIIDKCLSKTAIPPRDIAWNYLKCHYNLNGNTKLPAIGLY